ncbi:thiamine biosynthesis protein ThiJ [Flavilitoribacter nigricans DSM 23189 = NBRC 102662]|uniref:Thiamine biosynthesis protein ThiJ n=2 Tax=Flavilitoribacter TaxID=2762562 RepID=A0A2D0N938_FLAN2|nr:thiamine biosynthesis protein ThiJ [Flavilitoribacter nigricans DSM 23189 = NBRC 102662]
MQIAFILYDDLTLLDFIGFYDPVSRLRSMKFLPDLSWRLCATKAMVTDSFGMHLRVDQVTPDLAEFDAIFIPGGLGSRPLQYDDEFIAWIKTAETVPWKISVCTGSLLLGAAGFLEQKRATTHFDEYDTLGSYCGEVVRERIVADGQIITGGAVATSLDLGLYMCERWAGAEAARAIQTRMHYKV